MSVKLSSHKTKEFKEFSGPAATKLLQLSPHISGIYNSFHDKKQAIELDIDYEHILYLHSFLSGENCHPFKLNKIRNELRITAPLVYRNDDEKILQSSDILLLYIKYADKYEAFIDEMLYNDAQFSEYGVAAFLTMLSYYDGLNYTTSINYNKSGEIKQSSEFKKFNENKQLTESKQLNEPGPHTYSRAALMYLTANNIKHVFRRAPTDNRILRFNIYYVKDYCIDDKQQQKPIALIKSIPNKKFSTLNYKQIYAAIFTYPDSHIAFSFNLKFYSRTVEIL